MKLHTLFIAAALAASAALADTKTASSQVSLSVLPDCTISATDIDLGVYNFRTGASGSGTVRVKCNVSDAQLVFGTTPPSDSAAFGSGTSMTVNRTLTGPSAATIPYQAKFSFAPNVPGQQLINFEGVSVKGVGSLGYLGLHNDLNNIDLPVVATVAPGLWKPAGQYTDLIVYTLNYNMPTF
ncbi:hypothetical protein EHF33_14395 [Deinococcus psychrotolerans]|uniref:Spore coat protein U/FanG domain-containing protein n=1 Tax=Deinococcus psychrotolerans TaxID=2489213 RepID=A0A3G8YGZ0_9DEIO|nr:spore coat protein U domain-containing protein [Deinococcus psychrotolerans]AZI44100.1 hypothetical protein EHF33_14395 [Deinococcus psychrotolerans]